MRPIIDVLVDDADDIVISGDDIFLEENILQNSLNVAGRRIVGRFDDSALRENLHAGLERFLFSKNILSSVYDIKTAVIKCLSRDNLFSSSEYEVKIVESENPNAAKLYIIFKSPFAGTLKTFKVFVDIENQRIYKGND